MLLFFFAFLLIFNLVTSQCPPGSFSSFESSDKCFQVHNEKQTFLNAQQICQKSNGNLATISNAFDNAKIYQHVIDGSVDSVWIGFTDSINPGNWEWIDGSPIMYLDWDLNQPQGFDCAGIGLNGGRWITADCNEATSFVCEIKVSDLEVTTPTSVMMETTTPGLPECNIGSANIYLSYFMDFGESIPQYAFLSAIVDDTSLLPPMGSSVRKLRLYAANEDGYQAPLRDFGDSGLDDDVDSMANTYYNDVTSSLRGDLTFYNANYIIEDTYGAPPIIVMFLNNPVSDLNASITQMNAMKAAIPEVYFMGVFLSDNADFVKLPFDYSLSLSGTDSYTEGNTVKEIFTFICNAS